MHKNYCNIVNILYCKSRHTHGQTVTSEEVEHNNFAYTQFQDVSRDL